MYEATKRIELDPMETISGPGALRDISALGEVKRSLSTSIIIPTRNEAHNVSRLLERLANGSGVPDLEVVFVDDSDDGTPQEILACAEKSTFPVRLLHREAGDRSGGLSGAVLAGLELVSGTWVVVMDGDLQHPPELATRLAELGRSRNLDLVIATRYVGAGDASGLSSSARRLASGFSTTLAKAVFPRRLSMPSDPMSGFFAIRRAALDVGALKPLGFKILMEVLVRNPRLRMVEVPYTMESRHSGESKASVREGLTFVRHLLRLRMSLLARQASRSATSHPWSWLVRCVAFGMIGLSGLVVNTAALWLFHQHTLHLHYILAACLATQVSTSWLFILTDTLLYRRNKPGTVRSRAVRFVLFNNVALLLRLPILALLVDGLGFGVLLSNALTLIVLFLVRFTITDAAIYGRGEPAATVSEPPREPVRVVVDIESPAATSANPAGQHRAPSSKVTSPQVTMGLTRYLPYRYAIPGLVTIGSQVQLPELEYFRAQWLGNDAEIQIRIGTVGDRRPLMRAIYTQDASPLAIGYREHLGRIGANFRVALGDPIEVVVSRTLSRSPHVVYTNILEALLRFVAASRGVMLLHSACVELDGVGVLISARTDTGKTGTVLRLVREKGARFLSDDMTVLYPDGRVGCFPKPLTISHHTLRAVQSSELTGREWRKLRLQSRLHSREGRQFALVLSQLNLPIMGVNAFTQWLVPPPKYSVDRLLPCEIISETKIAELFVIQRGAHGMGQMSEAQTLSELMANTEDAYQFPPFRQLAPSIVIGEDDHLALRQKERQILESAISGIRTRWLATPDFTWADEIPRLLGPNAETGQLTAGER